MASSDGHPTRGPYRWMGGVSHFNSSQKSIYHYNIVELRAHERTFYGTGLTVSAAEEQAKGKADLYLKIRNLHKEDTRKCDYVEYLCGHAACPAALYKDPLVAKKHVIETGKQFFVSDMRMSAMLNPRRHSMPLSVHPEPKVEKIRSFVAGLSEEQLRVFKEILCPQQEYWDGEDILKKRDVRGAWGALKRLMDGCRPPILAAARILPPKGGNKSVFEHRLNILGCELVGCGETEDEAKQNVALTFLVWIRRQTLDLLLPINQSNSQPINQSINQGIGGVTSQPLPLNPKVSEGIAAVVLHKYAGLVRLMEATPELRNSAMSKSIAAVVLQEFSSFRVISLAGGCGTILSTPQEVSKDNASFLLKDFHSEILVFRSTKLFFYDQLELFFSTDLKKSAMSIFTFGPSGSIMMKQGVSLHLYLSEKPCGHPDVMRTEPSPSPPGRFQLYEKWDDSVRPLTDSARDKTVSVMSCADKIQKKCFLGVQGHLLSQLILPTFLGVILIGNESKKQSLSKFGVHADLERKWSNILRTTKLPFGFDVVSPVVVSGPGLGLDSAKSDNALAFCYYTDRVSGKSLLEYLDPSTGKQLNGSFSLLCKRALFLRFRSIYDNMPEDCLPSTATLNPNFRGSYLDCKNASVDYVAQKELFSELIFGESQSWIQKNELWEKFTCILEPRPAGYVFL